MPDLRGKGRGRRAGEVLAEVGALVEAGAIEVTLLGQNVNSYGVEFGDRGAFAKLLRACGTIDGLERVRFTSPHPAAFTDDVIAAMAETPNVMPQLHMPLQSGSDRVLRAMRRSYRSERFLGILDRVRAVMPDAAITTDIIVGFPGETEEDFAETMRVVEASRFSSAFIFQYSPRPGTPAATMDGQLPKEVVQERFERLQALQERIAGEESARQVGRTIDVLVGEGAGRKDGATHRVTGRAPDNRLVHLALPAAVVAGAPDDAPSDGTGTPGSVDPRLADDLDVRLPRPGDVVTVEVTRSAPHHLIADSALAGGTFAVRRTRSGDAWAKRERARLGGGDDDHGHGGGAPSGPVALGLPALRAGPAGSRTPTAGAHDGARTSVVQGPRRELGADGVEELHGRAEPARDGLGELVVGRAVLEVDGDLGVERETSALLAHVDLGPDALAVPVVDGLERDEARLDGERRRPAAADLEDLRPVAEQQEPEAVPVPGARDVAVVVDAEVVAAARQVVADARHRQRARQLLLARERVRRLGPAVAEQAREPVGAGLRHGACLAGSG